MPNNSTRPANKRAHELYKTENRVEKNKIDKLTRHCKKFPDDAQSQAQLLVIKNKGYSYSRAKPLNPGSNKTTPKPRAPHTIAFSEDFPKTAMEQVCALLNIPVPKQHVKPNKPKITRKPRKKLNA